MKKKSTILFVAGLLLIVICVFIISSRPAYTIILDINPSIKINLDKNKKVISVKALNNDAKDIIGKGYKGKNLEDSIELLTNNVIDKGYIDDGYVAILLYSSGDIENSEIETIIRNSFDKKQIQADIITIDKITSEDKKLARKNNISVAKASYINSILENQNIETKYLVDKSVSDLVETKTTGNYCNEGYILEGSFCLKEISREAATPGMVCPRGYYEYNDKCYEEVHPETGENLVCTDSFTLNGDKCSRVMTMDAEPVKYSCSSGEAKTMLEMGLTSSDAGNANDIVCVDYSSATHPVTPCELPADDPTERLSYGGRCYWHRAPVLPEGCPGALLVAGECWHDATNVYICQGYRDGKQYSSRDEYCEHSIKYIDPIVTEYKCQDDFELDGNKCNKTETEDAWLEQFCPIGYSMVDGNRCINYDNTIDKVDGYICSQDNSKVVGNTCIIYEFVEANN